MTSIREFQKMMMQLYFERDAVRGPEGTHKWLAEEVAELGEALRYGTLKSIEEEFADVLAWLSSLANVLNIDLEKAALRKYKNTCPKCTTSPCSCAPSK